MVDLVNSYEWKHELIIWVGKADEISVLYCFASDSTVACNSSSEADSKMDGNRIPNVMVTEFMLTKCSLIWVQALFMVTRNVLTWKRFSDDLGLLSWKKTTGKFWAPQCWACVHCTACTPYCYATGTTLSMHRLLAFWTLL